MWSDEDDSLGLFATRSKLLHDVSSVNTAGAVASVIHWFIRSFIHSFIDSLIDLLCVTRRATARRQVRGGVRVKKQKKTESLATVTVLVQSIFDSMFQGQIDDKGSIQKKRRCGICEVEILPPPLLLLLLLFYCFFLILNSRINFLKTIPNRMVFCIRGVNRYAVSVFTLG